MKKKRVSGHESRQFPLKGLVFQAVATFTCLSNSMDTSLVSCLIQLEDELSSTGLSCVWMTLRLFVANLGTKESRLLLNNGQALPRGGAVEIIASRGILKKEKALE